MKKTIAILAVAVFGLSGLNKLNAQAVNQGNVMVDVFYGFPNLAKTLISNTVDDLDSTDNIDIGGIGPVGGRFEYMISDKVGLGLEGNYSSASVTYNADSAGTTYNYEVKRSVVRFMPKFYIHFGSSSDFDAYFGVAAGYRNVTWSFTSNDPNYDGIEDSGGIPFALRLSVGGRYYFTDNIGLSMEIGFGGGSGVVNGGLAFKF